MAKKLIVSDLDGTLLDHIEKLSPKYINRLNKMIDKGLDFTIATGRDYENTAIALKGLNLKNPIILTNGAIMVDYPSGQMIDYLTINHDESIKIIKLAEKMEIRIMVFASYIPERNEPRFIKGKWWDRNEIIPLEKKMYQDYLKEPLISLQFCDDKEKLDPLFERTSHINHNNMDMLYFEDAFLKGKYWLEYNPMNARKEIMLEKLLERKGYDATDVVAFGDRNNDLGMLKMVGTSCVVDNAPAEVKEVADIIVDSNINGGVINYLEKNIDKLI